MAMEFFINNLCKEIISECKKLEIDCHHNFLNYYINLLSYDPLWNLSPQMKEIYRSDAVRLIKFVVTKMKHQNCPCIVTLKIQMYFNCNFEEKPTIVNIERNNFKNRLKPLQEEILDTNTEVKSEMNLLEKNIVYFMTLWRGLGNPTVLGVYREAKQALFSIYDESDLVNFMSKNKEEKEIELYQLAQICAGIRLFNWSCKKGGEGIEDLPNLLRDAMKNLENSLRTFIVSTLEKVNILTSVIDYVFPIISEEITKHDTQYTVYYSNCQIPQEVVYEDIEYFKDLLIVYRQLEVFVRKLITETELIDLNLNELDVKIEQTLNSFHSLAYLKVGVPTDLVFPIFIELDNIWEKYQNEIIVITKLNQILNNLELYTKEFDLNTDTLDMILDEREILTDADRLQVETNDKIHIENEAINIIIIDSQDKLDEIPLEFLGFCTWKLVETQGGLIPGNPNLGILQFKGKYYVFSSVEAAKAFDQSPDRYVNEALELARKKTELISLFNLEQQLQEVHMIKDLVLDEIDNQVKVVQHDVQIQTLLHPIKSNIDPNYMWNVWDWKKQAIMLANITQMKTNHLQTKMSFNRMSIQVQTQETKDEETQTMKDNSTNVPKPSTYFFGLRGRKDEKQFILNITRPVSE